MAMAVFDFVERKRPRLDGVARRLADPRVVSNANRPYRESAGNDARAADALGLLHLAQQIGRVPRRGSGHAGTVRGHDFRQILLA